jgi:hypothetical protein
MDGHYRLGYWNSLNPMVAYRPSFASRRWHYLRFRHTLGIEISRHPFSNQHRHQDCLA